MPTKRKTRVFTSGRSQHVTIPAEFRFKTNEVYIEQDPVSGKLTLSEKEPGLSWEEIFRQFDEAGARHFELDRDRRPEPERDLF